MKGTNCINEDALNRLIKEMLQRNVDWELRGSSNCWNTTRKLLGDRVCYEWEDGYRMMQWLEERCVDIEETEATEIGDIVSFWSCYGVLDHTMVLTKNGWFHKFGSCPFEYISVAECRNRYDCDNPKYHRLKDVSSLDNR